MENQEHTYKSTKQLGFLVVLMFALVAILSFKPAFASGETSSDATTSELNTNLTVRPFKLGNTTIDQNNAHHYETAHFNFYWGDSDNASKVTQSYLKEAGTLMEQIWQVYIGEMKMTPPVYAINKPYSQQKPYKINVLLIDTGFKDLQQGWAYADRDSQSYPYFVAQVAALTPNKDWWGSAVPHVFGHDFQFAQGNNSWNDGIYLTAWYEPVANWFREEYAYSDVYRNSGNHLGTSLSEMYLRATMLTPVNGRAFYEAWPLLLFLQHNPDHLDMSTNLMKALLTNGDKSNPNQTFYQILRANTPKVDQKTLFGDYASRVASLEWAGSATKSYSPKKLYQTAFKKLLKNRNLYWQQFYTQMNKVSKTSNLYRVPNERAPQGNAFNVIQLHPEFKKGKSSTSVGVKLTGLSKKAGADWRARLIVQPKDGSAAKYSSLFKSGQTKSIKAKTSDKVYLSVAATPSTQDIDDNTFGLPIDSEKFTEMNHPYSTKARYPYQIRLSHAAPATRPNISTKGIKGHHTKQGGFVANTASVSKTVKVSKGSAVLGNAKVSGHVKLTGHATVRDNATVKGNVRLSGHALVEGKSKVSDNVKVKDYGIVDGQAIVSGNAQITKMAIVKDGAHVSDHAVVTDSALVSGNYSVLDHARMEGMAIGGGGTGKSESGLAGTAEATGDFFDDSGYLVQAGTLSGYEVISTSLDQYKNGYINPKNASK